jgi:hypothetical protein
MNDEEKKSESFTNLIFGSIGFGTGKINHTDDTRRKRTLRYEYFLAFAFSFLHFFFYSSSMVRQMDS